MIRGLFLSVCKFGFYMIVWVFFLSISWEGQTLFDRANNLLVQNRVVQTVDQEVAGLWEKVVRAAEISFSEAEPVVEETEFKSLLRALLSFEAQKSTFLGSFVLNI